MDQDCGYFSFFESESLCLTYLTCPEILDDPNLPGITSEKGCPPVSDFCFINGTHCLGNLVSISSCVDEYDCLNFCVDNIDCKWFEYETETKICYLLEDCTTYNQDCPNCIIGSRNCDGMVLLLGLGDDADGQRR